MTYYLIVIYYKDGDEYGRKIKREDNIISQGVNDTKQFFILQIGLNILYGLTTLISLMCPSF